MIADASPSAESPAAIAVDIGNTFIKIGLWRPEGVTRASAVPIESTDEVVDLYLRLCRRLPESKPQGVILGAVVPKALETVRTLLLRAGAEPRVIGQDVDLPISLDVELPERVGVDRVCSAAAAFDRTRHACVIVSFGTAITVDLVSDDGVFLGGAILPGFRLQIQALNKHTAALPLVELKMPESILGKNTEDAIRIGVVFGSIGAVRGLVERHATELGTWPQVVATGGDMPMLVDHLDFVDSLVPDLCLMGIGLALAKQNDSTFFQP